MGAIETKSGKKLQDPPIKMVKPSMQPPPLLDEEDTPIEEPRKIASLDRTEETSPLFFHTLPPVENPTSQEFHILLA